MRDVLTSVFSEGSPMSKTIVLIHGAWLTPASWDLFRARYEARGFTVVAPPWPFEDRPIADLRRSPHPNLGKLTVRKLVDHYENLIRELYEPPILIGHSVGGIVVQMLLDRGLGAAGVAIDPAPVRGVFPTPRALRAALPAFLAWRGWSRTVTMTPRHFARSFANTLPPADQRTAYERHVVPTPGRLYYQLATGIGTGVNFSNATRAPLLLIAGEADQTIEPSMVRANYNRYRRSPALTELKTFPNRPHLLVASPGWEEVADYALEWAVAHDRTRRGASGADAGSAPLIADAQTARTGELPIQ
jgi:pimeloyl-ACP methyl ester carboxylesterase